MGEEVVGRCWHCQRDLFRADFGREALCLGCGKNTHVCRNCRFYAPNRPNQCQEPLVERVLDKQRGNFCDYFMPTQAAATGAGGPASADLLAAAEALFHK